MTLSLAFTCLYSHSWDKCTESHNRPEDYQIMKLLTVEIRIEEETVGEWILYSCTTLSFFCRNWMDRSSCLQKTTAHGLTFQQIVLRYGLETVCKGELSFPWNLLQVNGQNLFETVFRFLMVVEQKLYLLIHSQTNEQEIEEIVKVSDRF